MKKILILLILPLTICAQNNKQSKRTNQAVIENKAIHYEYAIIRAVQSNMISNKEVVTPQKRNKKDKTSKPQENNVKTYLKKMQRSQWMITFDFGAKSTKEEKMVRQEEFYSIVDALNFLGSRGYELVISETKTIPEGEVLTYYMRKPR